MSVFTYITDLPPNIRNVLPVHLQQIFVDTFNAAMTLTTSEPEAFQTAWMKVFQTAFPGEIVTDQTLPQMQPPAPVAPQPVGTTPSAVAPYIAANESYGYWVKLADVGLDGDASWIQAMPLGSYHHPKHGKIDFTPERVQQFAANINSQARGTELDVDYEHKQYSSEAAGWIKQAQARPDGLWILVEWTRNAAQKIRDKAFKYFSPEFVDEWEHPKTKTKFKDVLLGGALTNRPFLKDILPVNLSEVIANNEGSKLVDRATMEKLATKLGVKFDANTSDEDLAKALTVVAETQEPEPKPENENGDEQDETKPDEAEALAASEKLKNEIKRLYETDPVIKSLVDKVSILESANRLSEVNIKLSDLTNPTNKRILAPAAVDKVRTLVMEAPVALGDKILDAVKELVASGTVELSEHGRTTSVGSEGSSAVKTFNDKVAALVKDGNITMADAMEQISRDEPDLYSQYRNESFLKEGV